MFWDKANWNMIRYTRTDDGDIVYYVCAANATNVNIGSLQRAFLPIWQPIGRLPHISISMLKHAVGMSQGFITW